jgi:hypothetical protein
MKQFIRPMIDVIILCTMFATEAAVSATPQTGDSFASWLKDLRFKALYTEALRHSPANHRDSWVYKDIGLAPSQAIAGQNGNTWVRMSTCSSKEPIACRSNHIDIFYDPQNQELFAFITLGSRVGWVGNVRGPTSLEQRFFTPYLTAKQIR